MSYLKLSFAEKQIVVNKRKLIFMSVVVLSTCVLGIWWGASLVLHGNYKLFYTPIGLIILIGEIWIVNKLSVWIEKKLEAKIDVYERKLRNGAKGLNGEELAYKELCEALDYQQYKIYRNLILPDLASDLDLVVIGPKGIILMEVKNTSTKLTYTVSKSFYKSRRNTMTPIPLDLRDIVNYRSEKLEKYLAENGVDRINVRKVILYVNPESVELKEYGNNQNHVYIIQGLNRLQHYLATSKVAPKFTTDLCSKINDILTKL